MALSLDTYLFKFRTKIAGRTGNDKMLNCTRSIKIMVPLKYLSNFLEDPWNALEDPISCEINLSLTWFANYFIVDAPDDNEEHFASAVTLSTYDNWKLLRQLKSVFKRKI